MHNERLLAALIAVVLLTAQVPIPNPALQAAGQSEGGKANGKKDQAAPEERGTDKAPFVIQIQQSTNTGKESDTHEYKQPKQGHDGWTLNFVNPLKDG